MTLLLGITTAILIGWGVWDWAEALHKRRIETKSKTEAETETKTKTVSSAGAASRSKRLGRWLSAYKDAAFLVALGVADCRAALDAHDEAVALKKKLAQRVIPKGTLELITNLLRSIPPEKRRPVDFIIIEFPEGQQNFSGEVLE